MIGNYYTFDQFISSIKNNNSQFNQNSNLNSNTILNNNNNNIYIEEINKLKSKILILENENKNLTYNLEKISLKFNNDLELINISNDEKEKKILLLIETLSKSEEIIKELKKQIDYNKTNNKVNLDKIEDKDIKKLIEDNKLKDNIINKLKEELEAKDNVNKEIIDIKKNIVSYSNKMKILYEEIEKKNRIIEQLKKIIKSNNNETNNNENNNNETNNNENNNEDYKLLYIEEQEKNISLKKNVNEIGIMVEKLISSKEEMKKAYEASIKDLLIKLEAANNNKSNDNNNNLNNISNEEFEEIIKQNIELKEMNEFLLSKMEKIPELEKRFQELFNQIKLLKEENDMLKKEGGLMGFLTDKNNKELLNALIQNNDDDNNEENEEEDENKKNKEKNQLLDSNDSLNEEIKANKNKNEKEKKENDRIFSLFYPNNNDLQVFDITKNTFSSTIPANYKSFIENFKPGSLIYNTFESFFAIAGENFNDLYYYSKKTNSISKILSFKYNHKNGCLFYDILNRMLYALGGEKNEVFSLESEKIDTLPDFKFKERIGFWVSLIKNKIYIGNGFDSKNKKSLNNIEFIDVENLEEGWKIFMEDFDVNLKFSGSLNINNSDILVVGGLNFEEKKNENIYYLNLEKKSFIETEKELPNKNTCNKFEKSSMFLQSFYNGILSFINIDDDGNIHMIDNDLKYNIITNNNNDKK